MAFFFGAPITGMIIWGAVAIIVFLWHCLTQKDYPDFITNPGVFIFIGFIVSECLCVYLTFTD